MKEVKWICPQCGKEDVYFESESGDFTSPSQIVNIPWKCGSCGYPEVTWYNVFRYCNFNSSYKD